MAVRWKAENKYDKIVDAASRRYGVPADLIKGVIAQESAFHPAARREEPQINDRSRGLMQLLERTARALGYTGRFSDLYDPATNVDLGTKLLAQNHKQARGNWDVALSAYNGGFSKLRPWDAKRNAAGDIFNKDYVARVQGNRTYFTYKWLAPLGAVGVALAVFFLPATIALGA